MRAPAATHLLGKLVRTEGGESDPLPAHLLDQVLVLAEHVHRDGVLDSLSSYSKIKVNVASNSRTGIKQTVCKTVPGTPLRG